MTTQDKIIHDVKFVLASIICLVICTRVIAQDHNDLGREQQALQFVNQSPKAKRIALERYRFVSRIETSYNIPFYTTFETSSNALFPVGRSDRVYMLLRNVYGLRRHDEAVSEFLCFQRKDGKDKLVYKIDLDTRNPHPKKITKIKNLLNYINSSDCEVKGKLSHYVKNDLSAIVNYVVYRYWNREAWLVLFQTFDSIDDPGTAIVEKEGFIVSDVAKGELNPDEFFKTYGLPVMNCELTKGISK